MKPTSVWQVMTPIKSAGDRWVTWYVVASHRREAEKVAEQEAVRQGFAFDGDIKVNHVRNAITEDGE